MGGLSYQSQHILYLDALPFAVHEGPLESHLMSHDAILDLAGITTEDQFHDRVVCAFGFPHYYGRNQDAFWDCLTEVMGEQTVRVTGVFNLSGEIRSKVVSYLDLLKEYESKSDGEFKVTID